MYVKGCFSNSMIQHIFKTLLK